MVIGEANAFGVPAVVTDVGGIPTMMDHGRNGFMLPLSATAEEFAAVIAKAYRDRAQYAQLVRSSRAVYDTRLNWDHWADRVADALRRAAVTACHA